MARRFPTRSTAPRRKTDWIGGVSTNSQAEIALAANTVLLTSSFDTRTAGQAPAAPFTVIRLRGILSISANAGGDTNAIGAYGVLVVNGEAFDAGVASIPSPWTESFDDRWMYHRYWTAINDAGVTETDTQAFSYEIDSKSMRKMARGDVLVAVIENASTDAVVFMSNFRVLVKLH